MGSGFSCFKTAKRSSPEAEHDPTQGQLPPPPDLSYAASEPLDETLGHSFCYVRSSARFLSPTASDRFVSPSHSLRFDDSVLRTTRPGGPETGFKAISGASVSANTATPRTVIQLDGTSNYAPESCIGAAGGCSKSGLLNGFESTSSFCALLLQPAPRGAAAAGDVSSGFFMSGPIERGYLSGPLDPISGPDPSGQVPFSAPLGGLDAKKARNRSISGIRKAIYGNFSEKKRRWVVPVLNFGAKREVPEKEEAESVAVPRSEGDNVEWALGKAGEDRVHVVVSEEQGWLFVGIYDGFNGPDAPEFLMDYLYTAVYKELRGLFWEAEGEEEDEEEGSGLNRSTHNLPIAEETNPPTQTTFGEISFESEGTGIRQHRRRLWEYLAEENAESGIDLSGSHRFAFSVDDALTVNTAGSSGSRRWLLLSKLKHGLSKREGQVRKLLPWRFGLKEEAEVDNKVPNKEEKTNKSGRKRKEGPVDHGLVLRAMSRGLEVTENAYLDMTHKVLDTNPELALMGSCLLVVLMRDEDVYVMNVGDSRAIVAHFEGEAGSSDMNSDGIVEEPPTSIAERAKKAANETPVKPTLLSALQLSTDHSTSIEEEVIRIKSEHPDDNKCIVNDRVKGRLKVTRAFGAGFLKQPKLNDAVLEMFRNNYIGTEPYVSCAPSLRHYELCPRDQFLVLSSDGLYQYLTNQEVVAEIEGFMERFPDGDPAQHLIEEVLSRAAKKAGMDLNELLDIPQGDRRKYHDDVTVMIVSLEGRIWKSSGKYF